MPSTVADVFAAAELAPEGVVGWREPVLRRETSVYVVALSEGRLLDALISDSAIRRLLEVRPELTLDGRRSSAAEFTARIAGFWLPDETIVYIGKATSLSSRVGSYYRTRLGAKRPHAGGWWLKVLEAGVLAQLRVHYARAENPERTENVMIRAFCDGVPETARAALHDSNHPFPFANLEWLRAAVV